MTLLSDSSRLYDIATRQAIYAEGVQIGDGAAFTQDLFELREELKKLLLRLNYQNMDGLTKAELNKLIVELRNTQLRVYNKYTSGVIQLLQDFMAVDLTVSRRVYASAHFELDDEPDVMFDDDEAITHIEDEGNGPGIAPIFGMAAITGDGSRLWSSILNTPLPANGLFLLAFIKGFPVSAMASVESTIRMAWANKWSVAETVAALVGEGGTGRRQGTSSQFDRIVVQSRAVVSTAMAHVHAAATAAVQSGLYEWYGWYSVMDNRTTPICISRNLKRYRFGKGPLPPAHVRCRSHVAPIVGDDVPEEMMYEWLRRQPKQVQNDMLGKDVAQKLRDGLINKKDLSSVYGIKPLTLQEYADKVALILSRANGVSS